MEILKIHYKVSKPVSKYKEIKDEVNGILELVDRYNHKGLYNKAYAIAHCQVSETPYAFFVVAKECVVNMPEQQLVKMFKGRVIINPKIIEAPLYRDMGDVKLSNPIPNSIEYNEMCMSFPYRKPKRILRYDKIVVEYQVPGRLWGFRKVRATLTGVASEIFQHEYDHTIGKNIYFESETPVKWWELLGNKKPVGGISLDQFDPTGLIPTKEKAL